MFQYLSIEFFQRAARTYLPYNFCNKKMYFWNNLGINSWCRTCMQTKSVGEKKFEFDLFLSKFCLNQFSLGLRKYATYRSWIRQHQIMLATIKLLNSSLGFDNNLKCLRGNTTIFWGYFIQSHFCLLHTTNHQKKNCVYILCLTKLFCNVCVLNNFILPIRWGAGLMARRGMTRLWSPCITSTNSSVTSARERHLNSTVRISLIPAARTINWWLDPTLNWELAAGGHKVNVHFVVATFVSFSFFWK